MDLDFAINVLIDRRMQLMGLDTQACPCAFCEAHHSTPRVREEEAEALSVVLAAAQVRPAASAPPATEE